MNMNMKNIKSILKIILGIFSLVILAGFTELYISVIEKRVYIRTILENSTFEYVNIIRCVVIGIIYNLIFAVALLSKIKKWELEQKIYKYRFYICIAILLFCLIFELSGSSIACWNPYLNSDVNNGVLLGLSREIRSDEWVVSTPMAVSQLSNDFEYIGNIVRGTDTDMFIIYGQPVKDISMIFKVFQVGYLIFGASKGLSFFWCARLIALFIVTFEFAMLISNKNKKLSLICAMLITFAPTIQWWFAINGLVEMIVYAELAIILLDKYFNESRYRFKILYLSTIAICAGGYILTFYPAWMVPMAYIFLPFLIWVFIKNWKNIKLTKIDILIIIVVLAVFSILMGRILIKSIDTIKTVLNTVYPGERFETGGRQLRRYFGTILGLFLPTATEIENPCEAALILDFWPLMIITLFIVLVKERKKDLLIYISIFMLAFLSIYCINGFPGWLAKISLLSFAQAGRVVAIVGILNIFILIRTLSLMETKVNKKISILIAIIVSAIIAIIGSRRHYYEFFTLRRTIISAIPFLAVIYLALINTEKSKKVLVLSIIIIALICGGLVNPIRTGMGVITENPLGEAISNIVKEDDQGLWITIGEPFPVRNFAMMFGAPTINNTNTYPALERWEKLDVDKEYEEVYNRYAHISIKLGEFEKTVFQLTSPDAITIEMNIDTLKELNVKYIMIQNGFIDEYFMSKQEELNLEYSGEFCSIYEFKD